MTIALLERGDSWTGLFKKHLGCDFAFFFFPFSLYDTCFRDVLTCFILIPPFWPETSDSAVSDLSLSLYPDAVWPFNSDAPDTLQDCQ